MLVSPPRKRMRERGGPVNKKCFSYTSLHRTWRSFGGAYDGHFIQRVTRASSHTLLVGVRVITWIQSPYKELGIERRQPNAVQGIAQRGFVAGIDSGENNHSKLQ